MNECMIFTIGMSGIAFLFGILVEKFINSFNMENHDEK
jgi:hypothetical protein